MLLPLPSLPPAIIGLSIRHHVCHTIFCTLPNSKPHTLSIHSALRCCCRLSSCSAAARQPLIAAVESSRQLCNLKACARTAQWHSGTMQGSEDASEPPAAQRRSRQQVRKKLRAAAEGHAFHASALPPGLSAPCCSCLRCPASAMLPTTCSPICCTGAVTWAAPPLPAASSAPAGCRGGGSGEWVCVAVRHWQALHSSLGSTFDKSPLAGVFRAGLPACPLPALRYPGLPLPSP